MLSLDVGVEIKFLCRSVVTLAALVGLYTSVSELMRRETIFSSCFVITKLALKGLYTSVS